MPVQLLEGADDWEGVQETLFWSRVPGFAHDVAEARASAAAEGGVTGEEMAAWPADRRRAGEE